MYFYTALLFYELTKTNFTNLKATELETGSSYLFQHDKNSTQQHVTETDWELKINKTTNVTRYF